MNDERLMELVEAQDVIYNKSNRYNHSYERKKKVWTKIAAELDAPVDEVIKRYRALRDRFVRYKRVEMLTGSENKYRSPIVDKMEFLTPHVFNKSTNGGKMTWSGKVENTSSNQMLSSMSPMHDESDTLLEMPYSSPEQTVSKGTKRKAVYKPITTADSAAGDADNIDTDYAFREALHSFKKLCKSREEREGNEALHGFGQMIISTIAGMSTAKQTKAMLRVTELVMRIRMEDDD